MRTSIHMEDGCPYIPDFWNLKFLVPLPGLVNSFRSDVRTKKISALLRCCRLCLLLHFHPLRPSLHLPRAPCDKFVYDFPYDFWGIVGGYGLRRMCLHYIRVSCDFCTDYWTGQIRTEAARRLYGNRAVSVRSQRSLRKLSMEIVRSPCGFRAEAVRRYGDGSLDA